MRDCGFRSLIYGLLATVALLCAAAADGATKRAYRGTTSQGQAISFRISGGEVRKMNFWIEDRCPSGDIWRLHDYNFPPITVVRSKFSQTFVSSNGRAKAVITGRVLARKHEVTGSLRDRTFIPREHHHCRGTATFSAVT